MSTDIRWQQRFNNFKKALASLERFIKQGALNELEEQGLIKAFEYTYELAWHTAKDFYEYQDGSELQGSRDTIQLAFKRGMIENGEIWMRILKDRNRTSHIYDEELAKEIAGSITKDYYNEFKKLEHFFDTQSKK
ncbi:nucleotidyltransferase substrate binding protein [Ignavibacteriales bacterium]